MKNMYALIAQREHESKVLHIVNSTGKTACGWSKRLTNYSVTPDKPVCKGCLRLHTDN